MIRTFWSLRKRTCQETLVGLMENELNLTRKEREREKENSGNGWISVSTKKMNGNVISKVLRLSIVSNLIDRCLFVTFVSSFGSLPTSVSNPCYENSTLSHESSRRWPSFSSHSRWERQTKESFGWWHNRLVCLHNRLSAAASGSVSVNQPTVFLIVSVGTSSRNFPAKSEQISASQVPPNKYLPY